MGEFRNRFLWPEQTQIVDAICKAYNNADKLGADKTRFAIAGGSAGATLAIAVAYRLVSTGQGDRIGGLISFAGMFLRKYQATI